MFPQTCWKKHLKAGLDGGHALSRGCPVENCPARPTHTFFATIFGEDSAEFEKVSIYMYIHSKTH